MLFLANSLTSSVFIVVLFACLSNREILNQPRAYISLRSTTGHVSLYSKITMKNNELYQPKVDVGMLNTVKIYWADVSSVSPLCSDEGLNSKRQLNKSSRCLTYLTHINFQLIQFIVFLVMLMQINTQFSGGLAFHFTMQRVGKSHT